MTDSITDTIKDKVPTVLKALWDLENELRGAAQNSVMLRGDEARQHLSEARRHLDELLAMGRASDTDQPKPPTQPGPPSVTN